MKNAKLLLTAVALLTVSVGVFAFKSNKRFTDATALYNGTTKIVDQPTTGHWNQGPATGFSAATLTYGSTTVNLNYDALGDQVYFKP